MHANLRIAALLLALLLAACAAPGGSDPTATGQVPPAGENPLAGTSWRLVSFGMGGAETPVLPGAVLTLELEASGQAGGDGGCNSYGGTYAVEGQTIAFSDLVSTLRACAEDALTRQEAEFLGALSAAGSYTLEGDRMVITYGDGQGTLTFERAGG